MSAEITPFRIKVDQAKLTDLSDRLRRTRWPERECVEDWSQGVPLAYLQELCRYWAQLYDWRAREARFNAFPQFRTDIDGLGIHFLHVRSHVADAFPLVLTHGWPGSVVEFLEVIGPLTDPAAYGGDAADAFDVICPSLPGFAFSEKPASTGWSLDRTVGAWAQLMGRLGYDRYGAQGGDWGAVVTTGLALADSSHVAGIHLNLVPIRPDADEHDLTEAEQSALDAIARFETFGSGYAKLQSTRPQTIGYSLVDSPVGQCAWILERFWSATDTDGDPVGVLGADRLLDNVMFYWLTESGASSARLYWESTRSPAQDDIVEVPTGVSIFPKETVRPSRRWAARRYANIIHWSELDRGGHFAAFEQPELFVDELRSFFRKIR